MTVILAYVSGPDNTLESEHIADSYNNAVSRAADQPDFLLGEFNSCNVGTLLLQLEHYVTIDQSDFAAVGTNCWFV